MYVLIAACYASYSYNGRSKVWSRFGSQDWPKLGKHQEVGTRLCVTTISQKSAA